MYETDYRATQKARAVLDPYQAGAVKSCISPVAMGRSSYRARRNSASNRPARVDEDVELRIKRMMLQRTVCNQTFNGLNRFFAQVVAVLRFNWKRLAVFLHNPSAYGVARRLAILHAEDDLARVLLRLHTEAALIGEKVVVVKDRRRPAIPRLVVVAKCIEKFIRVNVALAHLPRNVARGFQIGNTKRASRENIT